MSAVSLSGRYLVARKHDARYPLGCPRHLRVICGTCTHFAGSLRGDPAPCRKLGGTHDPGADARRCDWWRRRNGGGGVS